MLNTLISIGRSVVVPASVETVWEKSFSSAAAFASWFSDKVEGEYHVGSVLTLTFGDVTAECRMVDYMPPFAIAFEGHPDGAHALSDFPDSELTTMRFTLEAVEGGTKVTVTESGFDRLPLDRREKAYEGNSGGWDVVMPRLADKYPSR